MEPESDCRAGQGWEMAEEKKTTWASGEQCESINGRCRTRQSKVTSRSKDLENGSKVARRDRLKWQEGMMNKNTVE